MQKFTLQSGTTNRHQWHKQAMQAIQVLDNLRFKRKELYGIKGGEERESIIQIMFAGTENETAETLLTGIGEKFDWLLTKDNADTVLNAVIEAIPAARDAMPVDDMRKTSDERAEQIKANNEAEQARQDERGELMKEVDRLIIELKAQYPWAVADNGKLSGPARAAKNMKLELKQAFPGVRFSVRSESFSMGNEIRVSWDNGPATKSVNAITSKYQYYIDKCTDDNSAKAKAVGAILGQSKYVTTSREVSSDLREQIGRDICKEYGEQYSENARIGERWLSDTIYIALSADITGAYTGVKLVNNDFIAQYEAAPVVPVVNSTTVANTAAHIEQHEHTKKGFTMHIVVLDSRVDRDSFTQLRSQAKDMGGWYSRQWGKTPGGFAFKEFEQASAFMATLSDNPPPTGSKPSNHADKFRTMADKMQPTIDGKLADRQTNTPKRLAQAAHSRLEGEKLKRTQQCLYALADLHDSGNVPAVLAGISSKKDIYELMGTNMTPVTNGYHTYHMCDGTPRHTDPVAVALWSLLTGKTQAEKDQEELQRKIDGLQFSNIPGYFPTPPDVIKLMLDYANLEPHHTALEPSAGHGSIADAIKPLVTSIDVIEQNYTLSEILTDKGYNLIERDFNDLSADPLTNDNFYYDRIIMNPPFEKLQDIDHVLHAYDLLNEGGRIVSVMSPGPFFRSDSKSQNFQAFIERTGAEVVDLPAGSFKESGTGVTSKLVIIDR